jgi:hypothetical protein
MRRTPTRVWDIVSELVMNNVLFISSYTLYIANQCEHFIGTQQFLSTTYTFSAWGFPAWLQFKIALSKTQVPTPYVYTATEWSETTANHKIYLQYLIHRSRRVLHESLRTVKTKFKACKCDEHSNSTVIYTHISSSRSHNSPFQYEFYLFRIYDSFNGSVIGK